MIGQQYYLLQLLSHETTNFLPIKKKATTRVPRMCDIFLQALNENKDKKPLFLIEALNEKNVYFDYKVLQEVCSTLTSKGFIKKLVGFQIVSFSREPNFIQTLGDADGHINHYDITDKGRHFVDSGHELDTDGVAQRKESRKKWKERVITAGISLIMTILTLWIKNMLKL